MGKAKVKVKAREGKSGTKIAETKIAIVSNDNQSGKMMYETRARIITRIERGKRPKTTRLKRSR